MKNEQTRIDEAETDGRITAEEADALREIAERNAASPEILRLIDERAADEIVDEVEQAGDVAAGRRNIIEELGRRGVPDDQLEDAADYLFTRPS